MEISAIMNIYELAANRVVKQEIDDPAEKRHETIQSHHTFQKVQVFPKHNNHSAEATASPDTSQTDTEQLPQTDVNGNRIDIHT